MYCLLKPRETVRFVDQRPAADVVRGAAERICACAVSAFRQADSFNSQHTERFWMARQK